MRFLSKFSGSAFILTLVNYKIPLEAVSSSCSSLSAHHWWVCPPAQVVRSLWGSLATFCLGGRDFLPLLFPSILRPRIHVCWEHSSPVSVQNTEGPWWELLVLIPADGQQGSSAHAAFVTQLQPSVSPTRSHHELLYGRVSRDPVLDSLISPFWVLRVSVCVGKLPI